MAMEYSWTGDVQAGGVWFKGLRDRLGKTLREVDQATGISQQNISSIEMGKIVKPAMAMLVTLGTFYGVTPDQIAREYGWWRGPVTIKDPRIAYLEAVIGRLSQGARYNLLQQVMAAAQLAEQEASR